MSALSVATMISMSLEDSERELIVATVLMGLLAAQYSISRSVGLKERNGSASTSNNQDTDSQGKST